MLGFILYSILVIKQKTVLYCPFGVYSIVGETDQKYMYVFLMSAKERRDCRDR